MESAQTRTSPAGRQRGRWGGWGAAGNRRSRRRAFGAQRPGTVLVAILIAMVVLSLAVIAIVTTGARDHDLAVVQAQGARTYYSAESAASMAAKELIDDTDHDGDGGIGTISNDGNPSNDPTINGGTRMWATRADNGAVATITAMSSSRDARREIALSATLASGSRGGGSGPCTLAYGRSSPKSLHLSTFDALSAAWGAAITTGTLSNEPMWVAAADLSGSQLLLATDSGNRLFCGVATGSGTTTFTNVCNDVGRSNSRPFHAVARPASGGGLIIYFDKSAGQMRYRTVSGSTISSAASMGMSTGDVSWARVVSMNASSDEAMAVIIDTNKRAYAARWTGSAWTDHITLTTTLFNGDYEEASLAVERVSGRLIAAFSHATQSRFGYRIFTHGSGWSATAYRTGLGGSSSWIRMASRAGTNEIYLACLASNGHVRTSRWNGSSWSGSQNITNSTGDSALRGFDVVCSPDGSNIRVVYSKGSSIIYSRKWGTSSFGGESTLLTLPSGAARTVLAVPGPSASTIVGAVGDSNGGVNAWSHNGTTLGTTSRPGTTTSSYASYQWFDIAGQTGEGGTSEVQISGWSQREPG